MHPMKDSNCYLGGWLYHMEEEVEWEAVEPISLGRIIDIAAMSDAIYFQGGFWESQNWNPENDGYFPIQSTDV